MKLKLILILLAVFIVALYLDTNQFINENNDLVSWEEHLKERQKRKIAPTFKELCIIDECYNHIFFNIAVTKDTLATPLEPDLIALSHRGKLVYGQLFSDLYNGIYTITAQNPFFEIVTTKKTLRNHELLEIDDLLSLFYTNEKDKEGSILSSLVPFTSDDSIYIYHEKYSEECYYDAVKIRTNHIGIVKVDTYQKELNMPPSRERNFFTFRERTLKNQFFKDLSKLERTVRENAEPTAQEHTHKVVFIKNGIYKTYHVPKDLYFGLKINNVLNQNTY